MTGSRNIKILDLSPENLAPPLTAYIYRFHYWETDVLTHCTGTSQYNFD
jgi:hypothetical protein